MAATFTFAVDNTAYVNVVAQSMCRRVAVFENDLAGTADFLIQSPAGSATPVTQPAGTTYTFSGFFAPGSIVGAVKTVAGSITMAQVESDQV